MNGERDFIPYGRQWILPEEIDLVVSVLQSDWLTQGPIIGRFENEVAEKCGARFAVAFSSGTAALHACAFAAGLGAGDEVITTPMSFVATANCIVYQGGTPVFVDVRDDTVTLDTDAVAGAITKRTAAIVAMDFAGHPADWLNLRKLAAEHDLILIDDASHALGAKYYGEAVGSLADMSVFSFHPVKHITTGEGGMALTDNEEFCGRLRSFRQHGIVRDTCEEDPWYYEMQSLGFNYRITDFQCALGLSQLDRLDNFIERRREIASAYNNAFVQLHGIRTPLELEGVRSAYHLYPVRLVPSKVGKTRRQVFDELRKAGLGVNVHYIPIYWHPFYRDRFGLRRGLCPVAEEYYESSISLPIFPRMQDSDVERVISTVTSVVG
jgi:perosamine synthetase